MVIQRNMRKIISIVIMCTSLALLFSCTKKGTNTTEASSIANEITDYRLLGRKGQIEFPEMRATVSYIDSTTLHWETEHGDGSVEVGDEKIAFEKLSDHIYFLNWIEETGFTVSQIINVKEGTVKAFWSYADDKAQGKRSSQFVDGKFTFLN